AGAPALHPPHARALTGAADAHRRRGAASLRPASRLSLPPALRRVHGRPLRRPGAHAQAGGRPPRGELLPLRMSVTPPLLRVTGLRKLFPIRKGFLKRTVAHVRAVDGVDFHIDEGETLGLVGESGCGKTTTGRCILSAIERDAGELFMRVYDGACGELVGMRP